MTGNLATAVKLTNHYAVPSDGCEAFQATYTALKAADREHRNAA